MSSSEQLMSLNYNSMSITTVGLTGTVMMLFGIEIWMLVKAVFLKNSMDDNSITTFLGSQKIVALNHNYFFIAILVLISSSIALSHYLNLSHYDSQRVVPIIIPTICMIIPIAILMYADVYINNHSNRGDVDNNDTSLDSVNPSKIVNKDVEDSSFMMLFLFQAMYIAMTVLFTFYLMSLYTSRYVNDSINKVSGKALITSIVMFIIIEFILVILHQYVRREVLDKTDG